MGSPGLWGCEQGEGRRRPGGISLEFKEHGGSKTAHQRAQHHVDQRPQQPQRKAESQSQTGRPQEKRTEQPTKESTRLTLSASPASNGRFLPRHRVEAHGPSPRPALPSLPSGQVYSDHLPVNAERRVEVLQDLHHTQSLLGTKDTCEPQEERPRPLKEPGRGLPSPQETFPDSALWAELTPRGCPE